MASVTINGKTYSGNSISITNGHVIIDGVTQDGDKLSGVVEVKIEGMLGNLSTDASATCGTVMGSVIAGGSVNCDDVRGNVQAGGSVHCDNVGGSIHAGGSVKHG